MPSAGVRGFLDASEYGTWLKHFQSTQDEGKQNIKNILIAGQVNFFLQKADNSIDNLHENWALLCLIESSFDLELH